MTESLTRILKPIHPRTKDLWRSQRSWWGSCRISETFPRADRPQQTHKPDPKILDRKILKYRLQIFLKSWIGKTDPDRWHSKRRRQINGTRIRKQLPKKYLHNSLDPSNSNTSLTRILKDPSGSERGGRGGGSGGRRQRDRNKKGNNVDEVLLLHFPPPLPPPPPPPPPPALLYPAYDTRGIKRSWKNSTGSPPLDWSVLKPLTDPLQHPPGESIQRIHPENPSGESLRRIPLTWIQRNISRAGINHQ